MTARTDFESLLRASSHQSNAVIFTEGEPATGIYVVLEGEVRVSISSADGKHLSLRIARKTDILGLSSVLAGGTYNVTAETLYPAKLAYVRRESLLAFLSRHPSAYQMVVEELSRKVTVACEQLRTVALSHSAPEKLARLLLEWSESGMTMGSQSRIRFALTHEQISEFIGTSRETVTRILGNFQRRRLVRFEGSMLTIPDRGALANYAAR
ncbi:MAG TPA: Crp/Fnr family transcriptional regulator [Terracidiphilus sp.]|nr:Crp/Fnr family transcriptional regulator [Terracidiphilus sp.]